MMIFLELKRRADWINALSSSMCVKIELWRKVASGEGWGDDGDTQAVDT